MNFKDELLSHAFYIYIAFIALFFVLSSNKFVCFWDCLRLWGAYPKALWSYETLQLGENAAIFPIMQSYPPGMPLMCYFISSFSNSFDERTLYITYDVFALSLLLPIIDQIIDKVKKSKISRKIILVFSVFVSFTVVLTPWIICCKDIDFSPLYTSLFIDSILGIFFGYHLSLCINKFALDKFSIICIALSGSCLALFKDSAILFVSIGIIGGVICSIFNNKGDMRSKNIKKRIVLCTLTSSAAIVATWGSWKLLLNKYSVVNHLATKVILPSKEQLFLFFARVAIRPATNINLIFATIQISLPAAIFLILFVKILLGITNKMTNLRAEIIDTILQVICYIIFVLGYYFCFRDYIDNGAYLSYTRYLCTLILCSLYVLGYDIAVKHHDLLFHFAKKLKRFFMNIDNGKIFINILSVFICLIFTFMCVIYVRDIYYGNEDIQADNLFTRADELSDLIVDSVPQNDDTVDVFLCIPSNMISEQISKVHHRVYYDLIDDNIRIKNMHTETDISSSGLGYSSDMFIEKLIQKHYSYVVFTEIDDIFYDEFKDILDDVSVGDRDLIYSIDQVNHGLIRL